MFELKSVYLNSAYMGPLPTVAKDRVSEMAERCLDPAFWRYDDWFKISDIIRSRYAKLLGCHSDFIALSTSVSELVSHVANGLSLTDDDEVVLMNGDYPSMILPWMVAATRIGFKIRMLEVEDFLEPARLKSNLSKNVRLVGVSHVLFNTGAKLPIDAIGAICRENESLFLSDVSQSFGGMTIPSKALQSVDILVGVGYKWLLGPYGSAFGYFSVRALAKVERSHATWLVSPNSKSSENLLNYSISTLSGARRFDRGQTPSFLISAALDGSLGLIQEVGLDKIEQHNSGLVQYFLNSMPKGNIVATPLDFLSNIVCVKPKKLEPMEMKDRLARDGVDVSVREGHLRVSFHFFNQVTDVDKLLTVLDHP
jgi:selenocysteine lyase/cysteine desulfurase